MDFDPGLLLGKITAATERLLETAAAEYRLGGPEGALVVRAGQASLLAWLLGRSKGGNGLLPLPFLY